ncbi:hypothetical protein HBO23_33200 [Pseudomonas sp. WS 5532]|uniref:hypothetical protein n=1 Tax=Pseudomonas sp. WS 5532 TaxID=2717495 RepID=UPI0014730975|nr:hypothetical protein [Pseudomonas sp. WS 5532]NMX77827.1 hypothetical protein [Pseudomonas sp. WS 5532]
MSDKIEYSLDDIKWYEFVDARSDAAYGKVLREEIEFIAETVGLGRFYGHSALGDLFVFEKKDDAWDMVKYQERQLTYADVCHQYRKILKDNPDQAICLSAGGIVFLDDDDYSLLAVLYDRSTGDVDPEAIIPLEGECFYGGSWEGEPPSTTRRDILTPMLVQLPDVVRQRGPCF